KRHCRIGVIDMKTTFFALVLFATAACAASGQRRLSVRDHETIRRTLDFATGGTARLLEVDNVNGSIRVTGYDGRTVEMIAEKTIRAESDEKLRLAQREVNLNINDKSETINVYVDQPGHVRSTTSS